MFDRLPTSVLRIQRLFLISGLLTVGIAFLLLPIDTVPTKAQSTDSDSLNRETGAPPYPILFVHGLGSSADTWDDVIGKLSGRWGNAQNFKVNLNADNNDEKCSLSEDIRFDTRSLSDGSLYTIDFSYDPVVGSDVSDESAIIKQGKALSRAITEVLSVAGEEKVILVGHSMGGLAIREYLQRRGPDEKPRWWVTPDVGSGHRVARVVTIGTPHYGSNTDFGTVAALADSEADTAKAKSLFPIAAPFNSEAIRDTRRSYEYPSSEEKGRYLYGGGEGWPVNPLNGWSNTDVNCNGTETDTITGINEVESGSFEMPLPKNISYTWVTSSCDGSELLNPKDCNDVSPGDGIVRLGSQFLKSETGGPYPGGISDTLLISKYHTEETADVVGLLRGIDEPDWRGLAYNLSTDQPEGAYIDGYFTAPTVGSSSSSSFTDLDVYKPENIQTGSITVTLPSPPNEFFSVSTTENGLPTGIAGQPEGDGPVRLTVSTSEEEEHALYVEGLLFGAREVGKYSIHADTRPLQHFSYQNRHGAFADTTDPGFATLRVPEEVPKIGGNSLSEGDEIGVFTPRGKCVGATVWAGAQTYITVFGNWNVGMEKGDSLHVRVWDQSAQVEYATEGEISGKYEPGRTLVAEKLNAASPPTPTDVVAQSAKNTIELEWRGPSSVDGSLDSFRYYVYRNTDPIGSARTAPGLTPLDTTSTGTTTYTDDPEPGQTYYYRVTAVSPENRESGLSSGARAFLYPQEVSAQVSRSFGAASGPGDYRLIALPGSADKPLDEVIGGEAGTDWQAYYDNGSEENFLTEYDGSDTFRFEAGNGFWVTATEEFTYDRTVPTVNLKGDSAAAIPLQDGWNIVSNPFGKDVPWSAVESANGGDLEPIWSFGGSFDQAQTFTSAEAGRAYYFLNDAGQDSLNVPYPGAPEVKKSHQKSTGAEKPSMLALTVSPATEADLTSTIRVSLTEEGDTRKLVAPPGRFEPISLRIKRTKPARRSSREKSSEETDDRTGLLMAERRQPEEGGATFRLRLTNRMEGPVELEATGLEAIGSRSVALIDPAEGTNYDLRNEEPVTLRPGKEPAELKLAVGSEGYVEGQKQEVLPQEVRLSAYPNPMDQRGTLEYALPEAQDVTLEVYDVLGRRVATLQQGRKEAGRHAARVETDGLSSGVYFGRLQAGGQTLTQKITVVR